MIAGSPSPSNGSLVRSAECEAVLARYGLGHCTFAVVGADRRADDAAWHVMVTTDAHPEYVDLATAANLVLDLRRAGEMYLAERLSRAVETAQRQSRARLR